jgi:hypothetical protein
VKALYFFLLGTSKATGLQISYSDTGSYGPLHWQNKDMKFGPLRLQNKDMKLRATPLAKKRYEVTGPSACKTKI